MKKCLVVSIIIIAVMLLICPLSSATIKIPESKLNMKNDISEEHRIGSGEPPGFGIARINVHVASASNWDKPVPNATVSCFLWIGFYFIPVTLIVFKMLFQGLLHLYKTTDENGNCTFLRPALPPIYEHAFYKYMIFAFKGNQNGREAAQYIAPGDNYIWLAI